MLNLLLLIGALSAKRYHKVIVYYEAGNRYWTNSCNYDGEVVHANSYLVHAPPGSATYAYNFYFDTPDKVQIETTAYHTNDGDTSYWLCPSASGNYITFCSSSYDFDYIDRGDDKFQLGYNGGALSWSSEKYTSCDDDTNYMKIAGWSYKSSGIFKLERGLI